MKRIDYLFIGILLIVIILFYSFFWTHFFNPNFGADQRLYWNQGYFLFKDAKFIFNPAFGLYESYIPIIITATLHLFGESYVPIIIYNIIIYTCLIIFSYLFTRDIFNSRLWAVILVLFLLTNNFFIQFVFLVSREISTTSFLLLFCFSCYYYIKTRRNLWFVLFNAIAVFAFFNDNRYLLHFIFLGAVWILYIYKTDKNFKPVFLSILFIIVLVLPWSYRNYRVNGYFFPLSGVRLSIYLNYIPGNKVFGVNKSRLALWTSNADRSGMNGDSSLLSLTPPPVETGYAAVAGYHNLISEQEYNRMLNQKSKKWFVTRINYLRSFWAFYQFKYQIAPGTDDRISPPWSLIRNINEIVHTGLLIPFFFTGLWFALKRKKTIILVLATLVLFHTLLHVIIGAHLMRYRYQVMPLFTIVSVYGFFVIFDPFLKRLPFLSKLYTNLT